VRLSKFTEHILIRCPQARVFDYTQDYGLRLRWDTFLREATLLGGATAAGLGVRAWCVSRQGLGMETEYVSFRPPRVTAVKMTRGPRLFRHFAGSWRFEALAPDLTRVIFTYSFALRFPFSLGTPLLKLVLRRNVRGRLRDLQAQLQSPADAGWQ
jgi:hypothetical protein